MLLCCGDDDSPADRPHAIGERLVQLGQRRQPRGLPKVKQHGALVGQLTSLYQFLPTFNEFSCVPYADKAVTSRTAGSSDEPVVFVYERQN